ncbi:MAG: HAD-IA family hydrolase [Oligoflexia bacterium]|nr:HAD-IA family hydrolase [Oligoflexia bacterium]
MTNRLIIFDLDGTLVDSAPDIHAAATNAMIEHGLEPVSLEEIVRSIGDGLKEFVARITGAKGEDLKFVDSLMSSFTRHYENLMCDKTVLYPGVVDFISNYLTQSHHRVGVVTNKREGPARKILRHFGHEKTFTEIFGADTFEVKKPHPKPLIEMMKLAGSTPETTLMIGDSRQDLEAAQAAGTHFVAVSFGYNSEEKLRQLGAKKFIHHYSELHRYW